MRVSQAAHYALRLNYRQVSSELSPQTVDRTTVRSAAILAALGIAVSSFSLKQMLNKPLVIKKF